MRREETLEALAQVDRELMETRLKHLMELRASNDLTGMLDYVAEDIVFDARGNWMAFPFSGPVKGKAMLARALVSISTQFENLGSTIHDILIDGERVAIRRTARLRHRGTSKTADIAIADFVRFREGLVSEVFEFADSSALERLGEI